jgi:hypothetical protein
MAMAESFLALSAVVGIAIGVGMGLSMERSRKHVLGRKGEVLPADELVADAVPSRVPRAVQGAITLPADQAKAEAAMVRVYDVD